MIKALSQEGILIHLHLFQESGSLHQDVEGQVTELQFYKRNQGHKGFSFSTPYSIGSRADDNLKRNLEKDPYPILFEGIESTYFLNKGYFKKRMTLVRLQDLQSQKTGTSRKLQPKGINKIISYYENKLRRSYQKEILKKHRCILTSYKLNEELNSYGIGAKTIFVPQFVGMASAMGLEGNGNFCLFHGKLSDKATEDAAIWLLNNVFNVLEVPLVVAGENPSAALEDAAHKKMHTCIVANPGEREMMELIKKAQLHVIPSFIPNGSKNAILQSIVMGRHILINDDNKNGMEFSMVCHQAAEPTAYIQKINELFEAPFTQDEIEKRHCFLHREFNDKKYVGQLIKLLYLNCL
jgi:hypothetical protein